MPASTVYSVLVKKEKAHDDPIYCCAWTKTRTCGDTNIPKDLMVTGGLDGLIKVWTYENNRLEVMHMLTGHTMAVLSVAVSPDGFTLASTSLDCTLIIWDIISGNKVHQVPTGPIDVWQVTFSPDGTHVVSGSHDGKLIVYGLEKGTTEMILDTRGKFALSVAWCPDGKYIASGAIDGSVCIFDVVQGKLLHTIAAHAKQVRSVSFTPNSKQLVTGSDDGFVKVFDVASGNPQTSTEHKGWVLATVSGDGTRVACATGGRLKIAAIEGLTTLHEFEEHTDTIWGIDFNAESNKILSVSKDKGINIYECPVLPKNPAKK